MTKRIYRKLEQEIASIRQKNIEKSCFLWIRNITLASGERFLNHGQLFTRTRIRIELSCIVFFEA
jgi:hypothetical protein